MSKESTWTAANTTSEIDIERTKIDANSAFPDDWKPAFTLPKFGKDGFVVGDLTDGFFAPSGCVLPLGANMPELTVLKYGGYFPAGTAFPKGVVVPLHAKLVNCLPIEKARYIPLLCLGAIREALRGSEERRSLASICQGCAGFTWLS